LKIQLQTSCPLCGWLYQKIDTSMLQSCNTRL
jgi:hypothetical protein